MRDDDDAFASWLNLWLASDPAVRLLRLFVPAARTPAMEALLCLEHELAEAAFGVRDASVAQAKLGWWLDEIGEFEAGRPRHPILRRLSECGATAVLAGGVGAAAVIGAAAVAGMESPADTQAVIDIVVRMEAPLARARAKLLAHAAPSARASVALSAARVIGEAMRWPRFAAPERGRVPLALLARHAADRDTAQGALQSAHAIVRSLAQALTPALADADPAMPLLDRAVVAIARDRADALQRRPERALQGGLRPGLRTVLALWREARHP